MNNTPEWIEIVNCQTIPKFRFDFPEEGIVKFSGDNNDGKSILRKFLYDIIGCQLHIKDNRCCLINDEQKFAMCTIHKRNGDELEVYAHRESAKTYYKLTLSGQEPVTRYLKDKGLQDLVYDFGFHYLEKRDFSLNVHPANTPNLFETTTSICNKEAYDSATEDPRLNQAIENLEGLIVEVKDEISKTETELAVALSKINTSIVIDEIEELHKVVKLQKILKAIDSIHIIELSDLKKVPDVSYLRKLDTTKVRQCVENMSLPSKRVGKLVKNIKRLGSPTTFTDISESMRNYLTNKEAYEKESCPVCGRRAFDDCCKV